MCGIFCALSATRSILPSTELQQRLHNRGPDSKQTVQITYPQNDPENRNISTRAAYLTFCCTVLSLRGSNTVTQPLQDTNGKCALCWNGEAWRVGGKPPHANDTEFVHKLLVDALKCVSDNEARRESPIESASKVVRALSQVEGPYAFVYLDHLRGRLWLGRDFLGRRSLLKRITPDGDLIISSVSDGDPSAGWTEIETNGVHCINLHTTEAAISSSSPSALSSSQIQPLGNFRSHTSPYFCAGDAQGVVHPTTSVIPRLSLNKEISFSHIPLTEHSPAVSKLEALLGKSLSFRVLNIPDPPLRDAHPRSIERAKLAILFSGGLDCTVLARISHDLLPAAESIDLLNVAFENPRIHKDSDNATNIGSTAYELCPDRITGRSSYTELQRVCPGRQWRFVAINVPYTKTTENRAQIISLMHPHNTEMDLSISYALYYAARGQGETPDSNASELFTYTTSARVLLSGLGADELFGGYTRHATAFRRGGTPGLLDELELDVRRLGQRNLGRDDRVMSHWSREVRYPYLDENILDWAMNASLTDKCGFAEPVSNTFNEDDGHGKLLEPGKKVLRCLAWKLGMENVATEKKRAIQFGARTAKMETRKTKGTQLLS